MRQAQVLNHSVEKKIVAQNRAALRQIVFELFEKFYVLRFWSVNENQIEFFGKIEFHCVAEKASHALRKIFARDIFFGLLVAFGIRFNRENENVGGALREHYRRISDARADFQNAFRAVFFDEIQNELQPLVPHNRNRILRSAIFNL